MYKFFQFLQRKNGEIYSNIRIFALPFEKTGKMKMKRACKSFTPKKMIIASSIHHKEKNKIIV
jgi:hypothetical protein